MTQATRAHAAVDLARDLAAQFASRADAADRQGRLPIEDVQALRDSGYLAISVPEKFGGWGLSLHDCVAAQLELAQGSGSTAMVAAMPIHIFGGNREKTLWSEADFERLCRLLVDGALINSVASEPDLGSPSRGAIFQTNAKRIDEGWCVNGHKNWSTGGAHLTHLLVGLDVDGDPAQMLVPNDAPGVRWEATWENSLTLRASNSDDVYFQDVVVPAENLLVQRSAGGRQHGGPNAWFPLFTAATYLGVAIAARNDTIRFALDRVPTALGKPIATLPKIQRQIGDMDIQLQAARLMLLEAASAWDTGDFQAAWPRVVAAKQFANDAAMVVTDKALQVAGGRAVTHALPLERYFRDARGGLTHPPSGDTALEIVGRAAIGEIEASE
jgi:alkylation response protein AidB-like acyl-CoA dehydrogenase